MDIHELHQLYKVTFTTEAGRRVLDDLERSCFIHEPSWVAGAPDVSAFNEGARSVPLRIRRFIELADAPVAEPEPEE